MLKLKTGIRTESFDLPLKSVFPLAAELGANGVEINARTELKPRDLSKTGVRHIRKLLQDNNLSVCSVSFPTRRGYGVSDDLERRIDATKAAMRMAFDLGCDHVSNFVAADTIPGSDQGQLQQTFSEALTDLAMYGQKIGARLAIRTGRDNGEELKSMIDSLPATGLAVDFDPAELLINKHSPGDVLKAIGEHVVHFRARDAVHDLSVGRGILVQLGRGSNDWQSLLATLEENRYAGFLTLDPQGNNAAVEIQESLEYLKNLFG